MRNNGFTLIELMVVVLIVGILAAVSIPNFIAMQKRAKEVHVRSNCHTLRLSAEDFAVQNQGLYALNLNVDTTPLGDTLLDLLPQGAMLENPFTKAVSEPVDGAAATAGQTGYQVLLDASGSSVGYTITGFGESVLLVTLQST